MKQKSLDLGRIDETSQEPKYLQVANRIRELIDTKQLELGDRLPSINTIISHFSISRDTAVKAYQKLKSIGIVESSPNKAYFISNVLLHDDLKHILLLTDNYTPYKKQIFNGLVDNLPEGYYIDVYTHSNNFDILKMIYESCRSKTNYCAFLIIPTEPQNQENKYFQFINPGNILFLDRKVSGLLHPAVYQNFKNGFYVALKEHHTILNKYSQVIFLTQFFTNPIVEEMKKGIKQFADFIKKPYIHQNTLFTKKEMQDKIKPQEGNLYIILDDVLLPPLLNECDKNNLQIGNDIGIIIINDIPLYEHMKTPISSLSTDFYEMGLQASKFITTSSIDTNLIPTKLIIRESI